MRFRVVKEVEAKNIKEALENEKKAEVIFIERIEDDVTGHTEIGF